MHTDAQRSGTDKKQPSLICVHLCASVCICGFKLFVAPWLRFATEQSGSGFEAPNDRCAAAPRNPRGRLYNPGPT
jgi:hypothetical protein